ncbi:MAG TPA: site-specific integrase, partial [Kineosporiaceae bacterium]|nr:site-specific integrase [Kineosporiaceae bacterium]
MEQGLDLPGAARLMLVDGVVHLDPEQAIFEAMLAGWERQQRTRFLNDATIGPRLTLIRRMAEFTNTYPWQWEPADGEDFITHLRSAGRKQPIVVSTARGYELTVRLFMEYLTDRRYGWPTECSNRFGCVPQQVFHEGNSVVHVADFEGQPGRRPLTYDEVQALFDAADSRAEDLRGRGRKGALTALRDSAVLKTVYAFGLRRREAHGLDLTDRRRAPKAPQYGEYGALFVRWGKASKGSPPKRRT